MQEYQRMAAHFGRDLVQLQQELHRMKVATKEQVENIEITREVNIIKNIFKATVDPKIIILSSFTIFSIQWKSKKQNIWLGPSCILTGEGNDAFEEGLSCWVSQSTGLPGQSEISHCVGKDSRQAVLHCVRPTQPYCQMVWIQFYIPKPSYNLLLVMIWWLDLNFININWNVIWIFSTQKQCFLPLLGFLLSLIWFKLNITELYFLVLAGIGIMFPLNPWVLLESTKLRTSMVFTVWLLAGMISHMVRLQLGLVSLFHFKPIGANN